MANPAPRPRRSGTAISAADRLGHRHPGRGHPDLVGHRPARRPVGRLRPPGSISGTPTTAGTSSVTLTATDGAGFSGSASLHLDGHQHRRRWPTPAPRPRRSGTAITPLAASATDSPGRVVTLTWSATGLPAGLSVDSSTGTDLRHPDHGRHLVGDGLTATDGDRLLRLGHLRLDGHQHRLRGQPRRPDATSRARPSAPLAASATDSQSGATLTWSATGLPGGLSIDPATGRHREPRPRPAPLGDAHRHRRRRLLRLGQLLPGRSPTPWPWPTRATSRRLRHRPSHPSPPRPTDSQSGCVPDLDRHRPARRPVGRRLHRYGLRARPTTAGTLVGHADRHRRVGLLTDTASFTWTVTNTVTGDRTRRTHGPVGRDHHAVRRRRRRTPPPPPPWSRGRPPASRRAPPSTPRRAPSRARRPRPAPTR